MRWDDRVYGSVAIEEPAILDLIGCPTFQRLKGVRQAGPSALAFPFKNVTPLRAQPGGLHPAAPARCRPPRAGRRPAPRHLAHGLLARGGLHLLLAGAGPSRASQAADARPRRYRRGPSPGWAIAPADFYDDSIYPLLEQPLPWLCADRLDYFLRDGMACGVVSPGGRRPHPRAPGRVDDDRIIMTDVAVAARGRPPLRRHEPRLVGQPRPKRSSTTSSPTPSARP